MSQCRFRNRIFQCSSEAVPSWECFKYFFRMISAIKILLLLKNIVHIIIINWINKKDLASKFPSMTSLAIELRNLSRTSRGSIMTRSGPIRSTIEHSSLAVAARTIPFWWLEKKVFKKYYSIWEWIILEATDRPWEKIKKLIVQYDGEKEMYLAPR